MATSALLRPAALLRWLLGPCFWLKSCWDRYGDRIGVWTMRALGPFLIVVAIALVASCGAVLLIMLLPDLLPDDPASASGSVIARAVWALGVAASALVLINVYFNYLMAIFKSNFTPKEAPLPTHSTREEQSGYTTVACLEMSAIGMHVFMRALFPTNEWSYYFSPHFFTFCYLIALMIGLVLLGMTIWHLYLIATAKTQIEWMIAHDDPREGDENPYDLGWRDNFKVFFNVDARPWYWILFPLPVPAHGDGFEYPKRSNYHRLSSNGAATELSEIVVDA